MALPNKIQVNAIIGSSAPSSIDNDINNLKQALVDLFGIPDNTNISAALMTVNASGLDNVIFRNTAADPDSSGELQRNGTALKYHNGSAVRTLATLEGNQSFSGVMTLTERLDFTRGSDFTLGTTDATALTLRTNNTERARITSVGIVLVGTTVTSGSFAGDVTLANISAIRWINGAGTSASNFSITGNNGDSIIHTVPTTSSVHEFTWGGQGQTISMRYDNAATQPYIAFSHSSTTDVAAPAAGGAHISTRISGGKTQLVARFDSGAVQVIAAEP